MILSSFYQEMGLSIAYQDERRQLIVVDTPEEAIELALNHIVYVAQATLKERELFSLALSGGSTPKAIYEKLTAAPYQQKVDWQHTYLFWGDERACPPDHSDSNFNMAWQAGFKNVPLPPSQIFRMQAESNIEENAKRYEELLLQKLPDGCLDLVMLGMGDDGHTASLFPHTQALAENERLAVANYVEAKKSWRMSLTFKAINSAKNTVAYILGESKREMLKQVLTAKFDPLNYPIQAVGTAKTPLLIIADRLAAQDFIS